MNADQLAAKFARKLGFGPAENKDATAARLASAQEDGKKALEDIVIHFYEKLWLNSLTIDFFLKYETIIRTIDRLGLNFTLEMARGLRSLSALERLG